MSYSSVPISSWAPRSAAWLHRHLPNPTGRTSARRRSRADRFSLRGRQHFHIIRVFGGPSAMADIQTAKQAIFTPGYFQPHT